MAKGKQWRRLTAERKFRIFLETRRPEAPVGEILRRHGLTLEELRTIEEAVESSAIAGFKVRAGHRPLLTHLGLLSEIPQPRPPPARAADLFPLEAGIRAYAEGREPVFE